MLRVIAFRTVICTCRMRFEIISKSNYPASLIHIYTITACSWIYLYSYIAWDRNLKLISCCDCWKSRSFAQADFQISGIGLHQKSPGTWFDSYRLGHFIFSISAISHPYGMNCNDSDNDHQNLSTIYDMFLNMYSLVVVWYSRYGIEFYLCRSIWYNSHANMVLFKQKA